MFILVLPHKENKLHPIHRTIKSQDNFNKYQQHTKLWFAWKIVLLQYRKQLYSRCKPLRHGCDLLEKSYFCSIANNLLALFVGDFLVVICLKNRTFAVSQTTYNQRVQYHYRLWFAWKIVLLQYRKQPPLASRATLSSCDLLEKSYFCSIANNVALWMEKYSEVVICLKNRTFAVSQTTPRAWQAPRARLWFAWKIVLLQYHKQQRTHVRVPSQVVICLKNRTFAVSQTARFGVPLLNTSLWFAWKIVLLQYHKQHHLIYLIVTNCCDLLEKSYFCSITNSLSSNTLELTPVVICLKNRTFAVSQTAEIYERMAWRSCDLLEKSYFCSITNSYPDIFAKYKTVVICLKNRTFAVSQTTSPEPYAAPPQVVICLKNRTFAVSQTAITK